MGKLGAIKKSGTLSDKAYEIIKKAIITNELKPGEILAEERLADMLNISRTPIRTALNRLVFEEIAEVNSNKNVVVSYVMKEDVEEITVVRIAIEALSIKLLKDKITKPQIRILKNILLEQAECIEDEDNERYVELDYKFHVSIAEFTGNSFLLEMVRKANLITTRFLVLSGTLPFHEKVANDEHNKIMDLIEEGNFDHASEAMVKHLENVNERMLAIKS